MVYKEIKSCDVECNSNTVNTAIANNAKHLWCDLLVFVNARGFLLDRQSKAALEDLAKKINEVLDK